MILAIESSCDESAVALFVPQSGIVAEWVHSQIARHAEYGGVVPDIASREHLDNLPPLIEYAVAKMQEDGVGKPTEIAVTQGPGLAGCLALGISSAKALGQAFQVPVRGINHLRGHAFSPFMPLLQEAPDEFAERYADMLPHLGLIVSGGNTLLFQLDSKSQLTLLGETQDDAAGEALDKGAKLLGLGYPGGPLVEKIAREGDGDAKSYDFPRAFHDSGELKFSFSGLKTSLRYQLEKLNDAELEQAMPDICASYQEAVVDALLRKVSQALRRSHYRSLGVSGGVSNNKRLREKFAALAEKNRLPLLLAEPRHTGDNAAMIALAAWMESEAGSGSLAISPSLRLTQEHFGEPKS